MEHWLCFISDDQRPVAFLWHKSSGDTFRHKEKDQKFWTQNGVSKFSKTSNRKTAYY